MAAQYHAILENQRHYFTTGATLSFAFRIEQLKKLRDLIKTNESRINAALTLDLHKPVNESYLSELMMVYAELDDAIVNLKTWMKPKKVSTPFPALFPGKSYQYFEPHGCVLIISPWNYPFQLLISPLIGAISAGNCAILKPSEVSSHTCDVILSLINENFAVEYITALQADREQTTKLLEEKFDHIFFTGSSEVGKIIMHAAAKHLTPVTLELGGKSPCIVTNDANLDFAARRIIWGKFMNAGQTCIAPDYLYVQQDCKGALIEKLQYYLQQFYGTQPEYSADFGRIINQKHYERLFALMQNGNIIIGGQTIADQRYIAPTLMTDISWQDPIMQEEIFGPLLPILTFSDIAEVVHEIKQHPKPLALYLFSNNKIVQNMILQNISFGGGCINDCLMHIANLHLPFGGVGASGMGQYHGHYSFMTFSHTKSIYQKSWLFDLKLEYPPFSKAKLKWLKWLLK